jgi:hypothetical protein
MCLGRANACLLTTRRELVANLVRPWVVMIFCAAKVAENANLSVVPALGLMPDGPVQPLSAHAGITVNVRTRAVYSAMLASAATIELEPNGHRTRRFESDVNMLLPVAAKAEN